MSDSIITKLKKIINPCPSKKYVVKWETSYHYQTKTSSRRGGYNRTRTTTYFIENNHFSKNKEIDSLTGQFFDEIEIQTVLIPIPDYFPEHPDFDFYVETTTKRFYESVPVEKLNYFVYSGCQESIDILASYSKKEVLKDLNKSKNVGGYILTFDLFIPISGHKILFNDYIEVHILDENIISQQSEIEILGESRKHKNLRLTYSPKVKQLTLL